MTANFLVLITGAFACTLGMHQPFFHLSTKGKERGYGLGMFFFGLCFTLSGYMSIAGGASVLLVLPYFTFFVLGMIPGCFGALALILTGKNLTLKASFLLSSLAVSGLTIGMFSFSTLISLYP